MAQKEYLTPRKQYQFEVVILHPADIAELEAFAVQSITLPESAIEAVEHGHGNTVLKTGGQIKPGTLTLNRILDATRANLSAYFMTWHNLVQDANKDAGASAEVYKKTIVVKELGVNNAVVGLWTFRGCWPSRISEREYDRTNSENVIESVEFQVDFVQPPGWTP